MSSVKQVSRVDQPRAFSIGRVGGVALGADLCRLKIDGVEVVRRLFITVRGEDWDTVPARTLTAKLDQRTDSLELSATGEHCARGATLPWRATATIEPSGDITYHATVDPPEGFKFNRIGLCILFPPENFAGAMYSVDHGFRVSRGALPQLIEPQRALEGEPLPLFPSFRELEIDIREIGPCRFSFTGDLFEMEDQRNWSDGSFKCYCTPLSLPRPRTADARIEQSIRLTPLLGTLLRSRERLELVAGERLSVVVPEIGAGVGQPLDSRTGPAVRALGLEHLRVELASPAIVHEALTQAKADAARAGCQLVLALHVGADPEEHVTILKECLAEFDVPVKRVLVLGRQKSSTGAIVSNVRSELEPQLPGVEFVGGTAGWFVDLNRDRPDVVDMDGLAWSVTPQIHGQDEFTMIEALSAQTDQAITCAALWGPLALLPGPITLRPHSAEPDSRQATQFAAAWTAGSIRAQALGGVKVVTFFQTTGPGGLMSENGSTLYPCFHVIAAARRWAGWNVLANWSSDALQVQMLLVQDRGGLHKEGLLVNLTDRELAVAVTGLTGEVRVSPLGRPDSEVVPRRRRGVLAVDLVPWGILHLRTGPPALVDHEHESALVHQQGRD